MTRRGPGEGTLRRRVRNGRVEWEARLPLDEWYVGPDGRRRRRYFYAVRKRQADARRALEEARRDRERGVRVADRPRTVGELLGRWLAHRTDLRPRSLESYESTVRLHLAPALGGVPLRRLEVAHVDRMIATLQQKGLSATSTRYAVKVLRNALAEGERLGWVSRNVARLARPPAPRVAEVRPFTASEVQTLLSAVSGDRMGAYVALVLSLGLRESEALGLRWEDIDLDARVVTVRHQLAYRDGGFELVEPKSRSGRRMLALPALAEAALRRHRVLQMRERLAGGPGWSNDLDLVFTSQTGHPLHRRNVLRWFQGVLRREGLPVRGIKELRHTAASLLHAQGLSSREIMDVLGHSDVRITLNTYTHVFDENRRRAAERMDAALGAGPEVDHEVDHEGRIRVVGADPRFEKWSGRQDLNLRPPDPQSGALPGCATPRIAGPESNRAVGSDVGPLDCGFH